MSATVEIGGARRLIGLLPADGLEATMLTAGQERPVVVGIVVANGTGSAATATIKWGNGTTDYAILAAKSIPANDSLFIDEVFLPLQVGWTVKVTSGTGGALTYTLCIVEFGGMFGAEHGH